MYPFLELETHLVFFSVKLSITLYCKYCALVTKLLISGKFTFKIFQK